MEPTPTYCTQRMADDLRGNGPWELMVREGQLDLRPVTPNGWTCIDDWIEARAVLAGSSTSRTWSPTWTSR